MTNGGGAASKAERRTSRRVPCGIALHALLGTRVLALDLMNLSARGMFVRPRGDRIADSLQIAARLRPGTGIYFSLEVSDETDSVEARGRVAWCSDLGVGVDFEEMSPALERLIATLLDGEERAQDALRRVTGGTLSEATAG